MAHDYRRPGFRALTAGFSVTGSAAFLDFVKRAFDAREGEITRGPDGTIGHGEIWIGDSLIEVSEARPEWPARPCAVHLYGPDTDGLYEQAIAAGAKSLVAPKDEPYGDRAAAAQDPHGNHWYLATRLKGSPIPEGYGSITPYVITKGADAVIAFMKRAFGAIERMRVPKDDGTVMHSEFQIDDARIEMADGAEPWNPMPCNLHLYVPDADAVYRRALDAGATSLYAPMDQPYGDRECGVKDSGGNDWFIATYVAAKGAAMST
jgi:uncharacterized glyoxalase superfamily protein PhnB